MTSGRSFFLDVVEDDHAEGGAPRRMPRESLGLPAWLWMGAAFFMEAVRLLRRLPTAAIGEGALVAGSIAAITGLLVVGTSEYNFGDSEVVMLAWVIPSGCRRSSPGEALLRL